MGFCGVNGEIITTADVLILHILLGGNEAEGQIAENSVKRTMSKFIERIKVFILKLD